MAQMEGGFNLLGKSVCMMVDGLEGKERKKESLA